MSTLSLYFPDEDAADTVEAIGIICYNSDGNAPPIAFH